MAAPKYRGIHPSLRAQLLAVLKPGTPCEQVVKGKRCGQPMWPGVQALDLGHDDHGGYIGIVHARCNRVAGQNSGAAKRLRTCKAEGCTQRFKASRRGQRYCPQHRGLTATLLPVPTGRRW